MKNWIVNNFWIKILSLLLAIVTWSYVNGELYKESRLSRKYYKSPIKEQAEKKPPAEKKPMNRGYITEKK